MMGSMLWQVLNDEWRDRGSIVSFLPRDIIELIGWYLYENYDAYIIGLIPGLTDGEFKAVKMSAYDISFETGNMFIISDNILYGIGNINTFTYYKKFGIDVTKIIYNFGLSLENISKMMTDLSIDKKHIVNTKIFTRKLYVDILLPLFDFSSINERVVKLSCGNNHGVILTEKGNCYTFGSNHNLQLGINYEAEYEFVTLVETGVSDIAAEDNNTVILKNGIIYRTLDPEGANTILYESKYRNNHPEGENDIISQIYPGNLSIIKHTYAYTPKYDNSKRPFQKITNINNVEKIYCYSNNLMFIADGKIYSIFTKYSSVLSSSKFYTMVYDLDFENMFPYKKLYTISTLDNIIEICNLNVFVSIDKENISNKHVYLGNDTLKYINVDYKITDVFSDSLSNIIVFGIDNSGNEVKHVYSYIRNELMEKQTIDLFRSEINIKTLNHIQKLKHGSTAIAILTSPSQHTHHPPPSY